MATSAKTGTRKQYQNGRSQHANTGSKVKGVKWHWKQMWYFKDLVI